MELEGLVVGMSKCNGEFPRTKEHVGEVVRECRGWVKDKGGTLLH